MTSSSGNTILDPRRNSGRAQATSREERAVVETIAVKKDYQARTATVVGPCVKKNSTPRKDSQKSRNTYLLVPFRPYIVLTTRTSASCPILILSSPQSHVATGNKLSIKRELHPRHRGRGRLGELAVCVMEYVVGTEVQQQHPQGKTGGRDASCCESRRICDWLGTRPNFPWDNLMSYLSRAIFAEEF